MQTYLKNGYIVIANAKAGDAIYLDFDIESDSYIETFYRDINSVKSANGTISGRTKNKVGEDAKFNITPKAGYGVEDVIVDNVSVGAVTEYEFVNIREDHTITAIFAEVTE